MAATEHKEGFPQLLVLAKSLKEIQKTERDIADDEPDIHTLIRIRMERASSKSPEAGRRPYPGYSKR